MRKVQLFLFLLIPVFVSGQRAIVITSLPVNTPDGATIYLAGSANDWNPGNEDWTFAPWNSQHVLSVPASAPNTFQGKITRGSWATVEGNAAGGFLPNRNFNFSSATDTLYISVLSWEGSAPPPTDLPPNVVVMDNDFFMPELDRNRRIRLFLPSDYNSTDDHYPVLYMHDGQNLFSAQEAFAGEWEVDEAMLAFEAGGYSGAIIVAIDNGGAERINEYTPWANAQYGGGDGAAYTAFVVNTLKPHIDAEYRTKPEREHTGIMGSSLGGLISHYAGMEYQNVFSKVGVFSPSFWFNSTVYTHSQSQGKQAPAKYFFLAGGQESANLISQVNQMVGVMSDAGFTQEELRFDIHPNGQHSEWFWAQEFPTAFEWLFMEGEVSSSATHLPKGEAVRIYPNPTDADLWIHLPEGEYIQSVALYNATGRLISVQDSSDSHIDISSLAQGIYVMRIVTDRAQYIHKVQKR
jgi:predicted alpha/beta superfamily hydrolase